VFDSFSSFVLWFIRACSVWNSNQSRC
jgi:hypothetical protein